MRALLLLLILAASAARADAPPPSVDALVRAAGEAQGRGDLAAMATALEQALAARPEHPRFLYHLAVARTGLGAHDAALALLARTCATGAGYAPDEDPSLAALRSTPGFAAVAARCAASRAPLPAPRVGFALQDRALVPEGLACLPDATCFVSSVHRRSITRVEAQGTARAFVAPGSDGLLAALGMDLDATRGLLWVATAALPEMEGWEPSLAGRTGVLAFRLADGTLAAAHWLPPDGTERALGDLRVLRDGALLVSDQRGGQLFVLAPATGRWRALTEPGALRSPQGAVLERDGRAALVADWSLGLMRVDLERGRVARVATPSGVSTYGIDGLYRHGRDLIAVQNGFRTPRVVRLTLDRRGALREAQVLVANDPRFSEPTLGAVIGDRFLFIANSQWDRFDDQHRLPPEAELAAPLVLEVALRR